MYRVLIIALCASLAVLSPADAQTTSGDEPADLSQPFTVALGHIYAMTLHQGIQTTSALIQWDAPISTSYDPKNGRIDIAILGARTKIESAKNSLEKFLDEVLGMALAGANHALGVNVTEDQVSVVYINRGSWDEIIRYTNGRYAIP